VLAASPDGFLMALNKLSLMTARTTAHVVALAITLGLALGGAAACGGKSGGAVDYSVSAQKNYERGLKELQDRDWLSASKYFTFIKSRFPYSKYAVLAELRLGDAQFGAEQYLRGDR